MHKFNDAYGYLVNVKTLRCSRINQPLLCQLIGREDTVSITGRPGSECEMVVSAWRSLCYRSEEIHAERQSSLALLTGLYPHAHGLTENDEASALVAQAPKM